MPVVSMLNQKGGVGKTSTCHHLAGTLAAMGRRVLCLDNDPQASLTQGFWGPVATAALEPDSTIAALYAGLAPFPEQVIKPTGVRGIDLVPGSQRATSYNVPDPHAIASDSQTCLRSFLDEVRERYDLVLIDCAPNLHLCSWAALVASDHLVVPLQAEDYGAQGLGPVQDSVALVTAGPNPQGLRIKIVRMGKVEKHALESDFDQYPEKPGNLLNIVTKYDLYYNIKLLLLNNSDYWNSVKPRVFFVRRPCPNPRLHLLGFLLTMFNPRLTIHQLYDSLLREQYGPAVFATRIPYATDFKEAIAQRKTIAQFKPKGASAKSVKALADEMLARVADARCIIETTEAA